MAETAGLVLGTVTIATLFTTCIDCFNYVQLGRNFGKSHQRCLLKLNVVQLRLSRWGKSLNLTCYDNASKLSDIFTIASDEDLQAAKTLLGEIFVIFQDAEKLAAKYRSKAMPGEHDESIGATKSPRQTNLHKLSTQVRGLAIRRQKQSTTKQKFQWAIYEEKHFNKLIGDLTGLVNDLIELFPAAKPTQGHLCAIEVSEIGQYQDARTLNALEDVAIGVDDTLRNQVAERIQEQRGHSFKNFTATDQAKMAIGDEIHADMEVKGYGHTYDGISASGHAKVRCGNQYGGKSLWDD